MTPELAALLAVSALRFKFGPQGWRIFTSRGHWFATTTTAPGYPVKLADGYYTLNADTPAELARKIRLGR